MIRNERPAAVYIILGVFFLAMFVLAYLSHGTIESGDSYQHYVMARYSFRHPILFMDHWGKPFFTLLAAPFAQFGFLGINVFNILCAVFTGYFAYRIACRIGLKIPVLALCFVLFAPIYLVVLISGLTEPLYGLVLTASAYLVMSDRAVAGALLVSFLPFVRSEGFSTLPLFALVLLLRKKWLAVPVLAVGTVLYSIIGYFVYDDILWIINLNPYKGADQIYGHGDLFHFVYKYDEIIGVPMGFLFLTGLVVLIVKLFRNVRGIKNTLLPEELLLIAAPPVIYFVAHSLVLWKGLGVGSIGTWRVMAAITPAAGLIALRGLDWLFSLINYHKVITYPLTIAVTVWVMSIPFKQHDFPRQYNLEEAPLAQSTEWLKQQGLDKNKAYYFYPFVPYALDRDPYDHEQLGSLWELGPGIKPGSIIIWDSHFCNESGIPLESVRKDSTMTELKTFASDYPTYTKPDGTPGFFEVHLFQKAR